MESPTTAYTEVQIDEDSISLTLISESGSSGAVIEDTERFTFEELQDMAGEHLTLRLSDESQDALNDSRQSANVGRILQSDNLAEKAEHLPEDPSAEELLAYMGLHSESDIESVAASGPEQGDIMFDANPADWSNDDRVEVVEVLADKRADEYVIQENPYGQDMTVASANPSAEPDEAVVIAKYVGTVKEYAFPLSRLESEERGAVPVGQEIPAQD